MKSDDNSDRKNDPQTKRGHNSHNPVNQYKRNKSYDQEKYAFNRHVQRGQSAEDKDHLNLPG
ncbi:hypothetical protein JCM10914A_14300 [Paenibacillus sp. JCM 10914]